jgi:hypothetical protein
MTDKELIGLIAEIWTQNGGDAEGLDWSYSALKKAIRELTEQKERTEESE